MKSLTYDGEVYEVGSMYLLPDDAWAYELTPAADPNGRASLMVLIPDATPDDGPFTPMSSAHARLIAGDGDLPWPVLTEFLRLVDASGDLVSGETGASVAGDLSASRNAWRFAGRSFEVNSYHFAEHDCWCYELYELEPADPDDVYVEVRIPDRQLDAGPFVAAPADEATVHVHGALDVPLPVFCHLLGAIRGRGDVVSP